MDKKEKGIRLINDGMKTILIVDGVDISRYVHSYKIEQVGGEEPKLIIETFGKNIEIITKELKDIKIITE